MLDSEWSDVDTFSKTALQTLIQAALFVLMH